MHRYNEQNYLDAGVHDLNMVTNEDQHYIYPISILGDDDITFRNSCPVVDDQVFSFPSTRVNSMSSRNQTLNNSTANDIMNRVPHFETAYHGMSRASRIESRTGIIDSNSTGTTTSRGPGNFHMSVPDANILNINRQATEISRSFTNFSGTPYVPMHHNQVGGDSFQPHSCDKLDGRLLSLGYQSDVSSNMNYNTSGGKFSHMNETLLTDQGQLPNNSYNHMRGSLAGFQNHRDGLVTPWESSGNQTLSRDDHFGLRDMSLGHDMSLRPNLHGGLVNMHQPIANQGNRTPQSGTEVESRVCSGDNSDGSGAYTHFVANSADHNPRSTRYMKRRMPKVPFNSSVLTSFHQNSAATQLKLCSSTYQMLPPSGVIAEDSGCHDKSGLAQGNHASSSSVQTFEAAFGKSRKRSLDLPPQTLIQSQRRKITPQTSAHQFSPDLLHNALGQVVTDHLVPVLTTTANSIILSESGGPKILSPSLPVTETMAASNTAMMPRQHPMPSEAAFVSPFYHPTTFSFNMPRSTMSPSALCASTSSISVVDAEMPESYISAPLPMDPPPTSWPAKTGTCSGTTRIPISATSIKRAAAHSPDSTAALPKTHLRHSNPSKAPLSVSDLRSSAIAALAKATPVSRASQFSSSTARIQWQGFDIPPTVGFNCMLCKRDLSFTPEGPVVQPPIPPAVAVLPCGHTFHDHCLLLITPEDEAKEPPCIPCAMGEK